MPYAAAPQTWEAGQATRLPLEWRLQLLVRLLRAGEVVHKNVTVCGPHHQQRVPHVQRIAALRQVDGEHWVGRAAVPVAKRLVPAACRRQDGRMSTAEVRSGDDDGGGDDGAATASASRNWGQQASNSAEPSVADNTVLAVVTQHAPVTSRFVSGIKAQCRTGASCAATCCDWFVARCHIFTVLSQLPVNTALPSAFHALHSTGCVWLVDALAVAAPVGATSQTYALLSQHVATRMLARGLNERLDTPSLRAGVTCTSLLGLTPPDAAAAPNITSAALVLVLLPAQVRGRERMHALDECQTDV